MLKLPYELWIGARYAGVLRAGRGRGRRDRFISFIAASSMIGIGLGVAALIIVLSVMNGFEKDVRDRMLSVLPHIQVYVPGMTPDQVVANWTDVAQDAKRNAHVKAAAPFVSAQGIVVHGRVLQGVQFQGISPTEEPHVSELAKQVTQGSLAALKPGGFGMLLGDELADKLGVTVGDTVLVLAPQGSISPAGFTPRMRQFTVVGVFSSGEYQYDSSLAFIDDQDAAVLFRDSGVAGVRLRVDQMLNAPQIGQDLQGSLPPGVVVRDWTVNNRTWFEAVQTEKRLMFVILALIVAVAAFNLLSSLVMAVKDKQSDIAILRTLGSGPGSIGWIFLVQGALIGVIGTLGGVAVGALIAYNIDVIVPFIEHIFGVKFLAKQIYFLDELPSAPEVSDIVIIGLTSLVLSLLATIYPSWRASRLQPAQVLRHD